jgi:hypothetical protein
MCLYIYYRLKEEERVKTIEDHRLIGTRYLPVYLSNSLSISLSDLSINLSINLSIVEKLKITNDKLQELETDKETFNHKLKILRDNESETSIKNKAKLDDVNYKVNSLLVLNYLSI